MELTERVGQLEICNARTDERLSDLERYQAKQNGSLQRLEAKVDKIFYWLIGILGGLVVSLFLQLRG